MIFQEFLRGVCDDEGRLDELWAQNVLTRSGLRSAWLRKHGPCDPMDWTGVATDDALEWHVTQFDRCGHPLSSGDPFREHSPFVSLSSGTVEMSRRPAGRNVLLPAWFTALGFATRHGTRAGWVFYGYVSLLGRPALPLTDYAEEVRDLHQHDFDNRWHHEGEIAAKFLVAPVRLRSAIRVTPEDLSRWNAHWELVGPHVCETCFDDPLVHVGAPVENPVYWPPEAASNVRGIR